jgi:prophage regulatory protein
MKFVRTKEVLKMLGVSRTTLWRMVRAGIFPQPVVISRRATGHVLEEVEAWIAARAEKIREPASLAPEARQAEWSPARMAVRSAPPIVPASGAAPRIERRRRRGHG